MNARKHERGDQLCAVANGASSVEPFRAAVELGKKMEETSEVPTHSS